jgi:hypothetical protein
MERKNDMKDSYLISIQGKGNMVHISNNLTGESTMFGGIYNGEDLGEAIERFFNAYMTPIPEEAKQAAMYLDESGHGGYKTYSTLVAEAESWYGVDGITDMKMIAALTYLYGKNAHNPIDIDWSFVELAKNYIFGGPRDE